MSHESPHALLSRTSGYCSTCLFCMAIDATLAKVGKLRSFPVFSVLGHTQTGPWFSIRHYAVFPKYLIPFFVTGATVDCNLPTHLVSCAQHLPFSDMHSPNCASLNCRKTRTLLHVAVINARLLGQSCGCDTREVCLFWAKGAKGGHRQGVAGCPRTQSQSWASCGTLVKCNSSVRNKMGSGDLFQLLLLAS